jgi:hypothetical protein
MRSLRIWRTNLAGKTVHCPFLIMAANSLWRNATFCLVDKWAPRLMAASLRCWDHGKLRMVTGTPRFRYCLRRPDDGCGKAATSGCMSLACLSFCTNASQDDELLKLQTSSDINAPSSSEIILLSLRVGTGTGDDYLTGAAWGRGWVAGLITSGGLTSCLARNAVGSGEISTLPNLHAKAAPHHITSSADSSV